MINKEAIIERLGLIFAIADNDEPKQAKGEDEATFPKIMRLATEALVLLKEQPPASKYPDSEFTKVQRKAAQYAIDAYEQDEEWCPTKTTRLLEACDRLDASEASQKELLALCKEFMEAADNGSAAFDDPMPGSIYLRAEAAIEKAEK